MPKNPKEIDKLKQQITAQAQELQREKAKAGALFNSIGDGIITTDANGKINNINHVALGLLGYSREDVLGKWFHSAIKAQDLDGEPIPAIERAISRSFLSTKPINAKLFFEKKDGTQFPVAVTASPIILDDQPIGAVEVFRDISADYQISKMKDDFISIASHELRTPATSVKQYIGMLLEGYAGSISSSQGDMLKHAYDSNERQLKIVDDLLRVAHLDAGQIKINKKKADVVAIVSKVIKDRTHAFTIKDQTISVTSKQKTLLANVDHAHLQMVITNILDNASKYSPNGTPIKVTLGRQKQEVCIKVRDKGIGISPEDKEKLFQKFSRIYNPASEMVSGSGLGLYWVKQIINMHSGTISVSSTPGKGSVFTITLPKA